MIAAEAVIAHLVGAGEEIGNENARVIPAAPAADNFAASERVHPAESGAQGHLRIDPTRLQGGMVGGSQIRANAA